MSIFVLLVMPILAATEDSNNLSMGDFWKPQEAKQELTNSAFKVPVDKGTHWGTLALIIVIIFYFGKCFFNIMTGDDEKRSNGFIGLFIGVAAIVFFLACTSTALDASNWKY